MIMHLEHKLNNSSIYYDPDHLQYVSKYHKMEKNVARIFNETELFQNPLLLLSTIQLQENALKSEYTKLSSNLGSSGISESLSPSKRERLPIHTQIGTCSN